MKTIDLLKKVEGTQTIESIITLLNVNRDKAIYYIHRLRKKNYVKTKKLSDNKRVYSISFENRLGGVSYQDIINKNSTIKITTSEVYKIYGKEPSLEETLIYAIKSKRLRIVLASLALFKKIDNWVELYRLGKQNHVERQVGALYDLSRTIMRTRKMAKRFRNHALPKKGDNFVYIISGLKSKDFNEIEKTWKVYLPFNNEDLEAYK